MNDDKKRIYIIYRRDGYGDLPFIEEESYMYGWTTEKSLFNRFEDERMSVIKSNYFIIEKDYDDKDVSDLEIDYPNKKLELLSLATRKNKNNKIVVQRVDIVGTLDDLEFFTNTIEFGDIVSDCFGDGVNFWLFKKKYRGALIKLAYAFHELLYTRQNYDLMKKFIPLHEVYDYEDMHDFSKYKGFLININYDLLGAFVEEYCV